MVNLLKYRRYKYPTCYDLLQTTSSVLMHKLGSRVYLHIISYIQSVLIGSCHMHVDCGWVLKTSNEALSKFAVALQNRLTEKLLPLTTSRHQAQSWRTNEISSF